MTPPSQVLYEFEFQFPEIQIWVKTDVSVQEAFDCITTGLLRNKPVAKIKLFAINEEGTSHSFTYDIIAAKSGAGNPWGIFSTTYQTQND